jgi:hypothetical protein
MSKKLIAVAAAAALALTGLVSAPASASAITNVTIYSNGANAGTAFTASHVDADSAVRANTFAAARNVVFSTSVTNAATRTAVRFDVNTAAAASAINVTATGGVRLIATIASTTKVDGGSQALNGSTVAGALTYTFYAWNTSATAGSVKIDTGSSSMTFYVVGITGDAYNIVNPTWPTSLPQSSTTGKVTFGLTDAYGNPVSAASPVTLTTLGAGTPTVAYSATSKLWESTLTVSATATSVALQIALTAADLSTNGFAKPVDVAFTTVASGSLSAQVTALTAQVASLNAQLAALTASTVTKAKYNKLVRKWNRANPSNKVKRVS